MSNTPGIVFFLSSEWSRYHRPGLLRAVAEVSSSPVLVVDNPVCLTTARWHRPERWRRWCEHHTLPARLHAVGGNLILLDASVVLHDKVACLVPGIRAINRRMLAAQVRAALLHLGVPAPMVSWFQFPTQSHYPGLLDESLALYECYDEHSDVPGLSPRARRQLVGLEKRLMARCGLVFATSMPLFEARSTQHPNVALTYNAADCDFFAPVVADSLRCVESRRGNPPTVGYLGTLHEHTDVALLASLAIQRPDWQFIIIGPVQPGVAEAALAQLRAAANVELHGWVNEANLRSLLCRFDVGVIPYSSGARFNRFVNPNKLHEYTAMGKPIVATRGLDVSSHEGAVVEASGVDEFMAAIEAQHSSNTLQLVQQRLAMARANSWQTRAQLMLGHIERTLRADAAASAGDAWGQA